MDDIFPRSYPNGGTSPDPAVRIEDGFATELTLLVTALEVNCVIGVYPGERDRAQRLCLDLELKAQPPAAFDDDFVKVVDYGTTVERVKQVCAENDAHLLETLGDRILTACFEDQRILAASVSIRKLDLDRAAKGIGIALTRRRLPAQES
ncbi:dihydroneopterin aldolase [Algihabitans albus]|uniref:dihydroneopterin aldolase n=1 Tax=Algihabitans albus TaxID=2164067 RepID=UPI000E5C59EC|nr:dihydroneopterin aldolase [Algihabitans albus]